MYILKNTWKAAVTEMQISILKKKILKVVTGTLLTTQMHYAYFPPASRFCLNDITIDLA